MLGFLVGCAPGLTATRVEGIATYTTAAKKIADASELVKQYEFESAPEWKSLNGRGTLARIELKSALAKGSEKEVADLTKELNDVASRVDMNHLDGIFGVFKAPVIIGQFEKMLVTYKLTSDAQWLKAKTALATAARILSVAVTSGSDKDLKDARASFQAAVGNLRGTVYKLLDVARSVEACSHATCPSDTTCKARWEVYCVDEKAHKIVKPVHVEAYTDANGDQHPGGYGTGDVLNKGPVTREPAGK